jgi:hypothetical protein
VAAGVERSTAYPFPSRALFFRRLTQQVTSSVARPGIPADDLLAAGVTLGTVALWGLVFHLLAG